jgi:Flp pilus assembly protein TadD
MATVKSISEQADQLLQVGRDGDAASLYQQILEHVPNHVNATYKLGLLAYRRGDFKTGLQFVSQANQLQPNNAVFLNDLGCGQLGLGNVADAVTSFQRAVKLDPAFAGAMCNLGIALVAMDQHAPAIETFRRTIDLDPGHIAAHHQLGLAQAVSGAGVDAIAALRRAAVLAPASSEIHRDLAILALESGHIEMALAALVRAVALEPENSSLQLQIARVYHNLGRYLDASHHAHKACTGEPHNAVAANLLGQTEERLHRPSAALASYLKAVAIDPQFTEALHNVASTYVTYGERELAETFLSRAISTGRAPATTYMQMAILQGSELHHVHRRTMEDWFERETDRTQRAYLAYGLVRANGKHAPDDYFDALHVANQLLFEAPGHYYAHDVGYMTHVREILDEAFMCRSKPCGVEDSRPIFVVGMPRSGTSLVEQILSSHPLVHGAGEVMALADALSAALSESSVHSNPDAIRTLGAEDLTAIGNEYGSRLTALAGPTHRVVDKMPSNIYLLGIIQLALPNARIVYCSRDPRDVCLSIYENKFAAGHQYSYNYASLAEYYRAHHQLVTHWRSLFADAIYEVRYEDVVNNQERTTRQLLDYSGLDWYGGCLDFHLTQRAVRTSSSLQVKRPLYDDSVGAWRRYEKQLQPLFDRLGPVLDGWT